MALRSPLLRLASTLRLSGTPFLNRFSTAGKLHKHNTRPPCFVFKFLFAKSLHFYWIFRSSSEVDRSKADPELRSLARFQATSWLLFFYYISGRFPMPGRILAYTRSGQHRFCLWTCPVLLGVLEDVPISWLRMLQDELLPWIGSWVVFGSSFLCCVYPWDWRFQGLQLSMLLFCWAHVIVEALESGSLPILHSGENRSPVHLGWSLVIYLHLWRHRGELRRVMASSPHAR
jgi:hypothetical protein